MPKALRRANFSGHHARLFSVTAFVSTAALAESRIAPSRLSSVEGNPGIFQTPPRHARALAALTTAGGKHRLRLIVGLRDPLDLAFSLWSSAQMLLIQLQTEKVHEKRALVEIAGLSRAQYYASFMAVHAGMDAVTCLLAALIGVGTYMAYIARRFNDSLVRFEI